MVSSKLRKRNRLIFGVGINDANYNVVKHELVNGKRKIVWTCPFYVKWKDMLKRCYDDKLKAKFPTYEGCFTVDKWLTFSNFKIWMLEQDWENKHLDKDILFPGNKAYGPEFCVFVEPRVNLFLTERTVNKGDLPIGVSWHNRDCKFRARCHSVVTGKSQTLGYFDTPEEAYHAWLEFKTAQAHILAGQQEDKRVAKALIDRFENYKSGWK